MGLRRRWLGMRCKTSFMIMFLLLGVVGLLVSYHLYKELLSTNNQSSRNVYPAFERRKSKYQANKHNGILDPSLLAPAVFQRDLTSKIVELRGNYDAVSIKDVISFLNNLNPSDWSLAPQPDELAIELKHLLLDLDIESKMTCKDIDTLRLSISLAQSNRKYIDRGMSEDNQRNEYAVISQNVDIDTKIACMKKIYDDEHCTPMGNYKLLQQLLLLAVLKHANIIELRGYCIRGDGISSELRKKGVVYITDIGTPVRVGAFSLITWKKRLTLGLEMLDLLDYLENNPLGSIGLGKITTHDFILLYNDESLRLVDVNDFKLTERSCSSSSECDIGGIDYGIECSNGACNGLNALSNLQKLSIVVLDPLLRNGPPYSRQSLNDVLDKLRSLKITKQKLKTELQKLLDEAVINRNSNNNYHDNNNRQNNEVPNQQDNNQDQDKNNSDEDKRKDKQDIRNNLEYQQPNNQNNNGVVESTYTDYARIDQSNFPGMFDYKCDNSRVAWGCVITCRSLREAKKRCNEDTSCKAFVIFSTQPELDTLMTVVLKNSGNAQGQPNPGTTLFIRRKRSGSALISQKDPNVVQMGQNNKDTYGVIRNVGEVKVVPPSSNHTTSKHSINLCLRKIFKGHEEPRKSREKRLMAHFGLKGMREVEWQRSVERQKAGSFSNLIMAKGNIARGGKFLVSLKGEGGNELVSKAIFTAEEGESQYHVAQSIVYHTDRLLGLYHTPPSTPGKIPAITVQKYQKNNSWKESFATVLTRDGGLIGIFSAPVPHVMKQETIKMKSLKTMTQNIVKFSRQSKLQFEYVFLWWLTKMIKDPTDHIGYKGHLIHFNGDEAFVGGVTKNLTGYFNHCQFPNIVFKTLNCLRCHNSQGVQLSSICHLGQEVMKRVKMAGFDSDDIFIHGLNENDIVVKINDAASIAMGMVEGCIKVYGQEQVLY
ncbi:hypothetical protein LOTGIDRAFT_153060 [Lottia gigantea]|uniref:Uncharacterized protein n=1 Tax=Lottia gigantea TaxID=225164 RepID=V4ASV8_LOTGI|nr:hypothetical protein LOTGIDRAFT_153060 [Lottia gigantea]ESO97950.1 hypothetical protein LOTGIDRAFT_153060 [Lottia gigantea]